MLGAVYATRYSSEMTNARSRPETAPRTRALARWSVIVAAGGVLLVAYAWTAFDLWPSNESGSKPQTSNDTVEMADIRAVEAILETVQKAVEQRQFNQARTVLETAIVQYERDQALRLALADLLVRMSRPQPDDQGNEPEPLTEAEQRAFTQAAYEQFLAALQIGPRTAQTEFAAGSLARELDDTSAAIAHFQSAAALDAASAIYPLHLAQVYFARDELAPANAQLAIAVSLDPEQATAWGMMAEIALRQSSPRIALQHLERATALQPRLPAWRDMQARAHNRVMEPDLAIEALDALVDADRYTRSALQRAAEAYGLSQNPEAALARYEHAIAAGVKDMRIYLDAASWAERLHRTDRAIEFARTAAMAEVPGARRVLDRLEASP